MDRTTTLVKNTAILSIGTICTKILTFVMIPLFSKWLTPSEFGDFDLLCTYITLLIPLVTLSCGEALFRKLLDAQDKENSESITSTCICIVACGGFLALILGGWIMNIFRPQLTLPFLLLYTGELLNSFLMYYVRGVRKLKIYAISSILFVISMSVFVTVFVFHFHLGLPGILCGYAIGYFCSATLLFVQSDIHKNFCLKSVNYNTFKNIISYSAPLIPNSISWWIANVSDRTIISIVLGSVANGVYALSNKIPAICTALFSVFHLSWQETASDTIRSSDRESYFNKIFNKTFILIVSISIFVLSTNRFLFDYVFDAKYFEGRYYVSILMAAIIFSFMAQFIGGVFIALQNTKVNGITTVIAAIINILLNVLFINKIGLYAASLSTFLSYFILYCIRIRIIQNEIKLRVNSNVIIVSLCFILYSIFQYVNSIVVHIVLLPISVILFAVFNKEMLRPFYNKICKIISVK